MECCELNESELEKSGFLEMLLRFASELDAPLSSEQAVLCYEHARLMLEWNSRVNLTRITDMREVVIKHFLDSIIPAKWLPVTGLALDVGTGPGFPGVPLKILRPELRMVLLEANRKKVSFLKFLLTRLGLKDLQALQARWEDLGKADGPIAQASCRLVTMRAVRLEPGHLSLLAAEILEPGGIFAWWAGPEADVESAAEGIALGSGGMHFLARHAYRLPGADAPRQLLVWRKEA
jgi:16S rRNA (guanine527-N7)-methyltransferase